MEKLEKLLSTEELADRYGFKEATLRKWRYLRKGPRTVKRGGRVFYKESDVLAWEAEQDEQVESA